MTYKEFADFVQEGNIGMNEFVLLQKELAGEHEDQKQKHGYLGTSELAMQFLMEYEERFSTDF